MWYDLTMITTYEVTLKISVVHPDKTTVREDSVKHVINLLLHEASEPQNYDVSHTKTNCFTFPANAFSAISNLKVNGINQPLLEFGTDLVQFRHISNV